MKKQARGHEKLTFRILLGKCFSTLVTFDSDDLYECRTTKSLSNSKLGTVRIESMGRLPGHDVTNVYLQYILHALVLPVITMAAHNRNYKL